MNLNSKLAALKKRKTHKPTAAAPASRKAGKFGVPRWAWIALALLVVGGGTLAVFEFLIWTKVPPALVGTWEVQHGSLSGGTLTFSRDGTLQMRHRTADVRWNVSVQDKALVMTTRSAYGPAEQTQRGFIRELTANSLVLELDKGEVLTLVRRH
jgi:hypothetical protein